MRTVSILLSSLLFATVALAGGEYESYLIEIPGELMDTPKEREKICKALDVADAGWKEMTNATDSVWIYDINELQLKGKKGKDDDVWKFTGIPKKWRDMIVVHVGANLQDFAASSGRHEKPRPQE